MSSLSFVCLGAYLQLVAREAAAVIVEHTIPALSVTIGAELRVAAGVVIEAIDPALLVAHDKLGGVRRRAGLGAGRPAVAVLAAVVGHAPSTFAAVSLLIGVSSAGTPSRFARISSGTSRPSSAERTSHQSSHSPPKK